MSNKLRTWLRYAWLAFALLIVMVGMAVFVVSFIFTILTWIS